MKSSYKKKSLNEFTKRVDNLIESIKVIHTLDRLSEREEWYFRHYIFLKNLNSASCDLGVNLAGAALALELLDEVERLSAKLAGPDR